MARMDSSHTPLTLSDSESSSLITRVYGEELQRDIVTVSTSPVVDGIMKLVGGLFAVLNADRQILAVNEAFLDEMGLGEGAEVLGLRMGEAIRCIHAGDGSGECGEGKFCATCGAAIAIVTSLAGNLTEERKCTATIRRGDSLIDLCLRVRSAPYDIGGRRFLMLFIQDVTAEEQWAEVERAFFHDLGNIVTGLIGASELLSGRTTGGQEVAEIIHRQVLRLDRELKIQRSLAQAGTGDYRPLFRDIPVAQVLEELRELFAVHPAAKDKVLRLPERVPGLLVSTDLPLLLRVLANMLTNAFEATDDGGEVRLWVEEGDAAVTICVWNREAIPEAIACRIFQRSFSTKSEHGRGIGTYMMKRFGEQILGGRVQFSSSEKDGTVFRFVLPLAGKE